MGGRGSASFVHFDLYMSILYKYTVSSNENTYICLVDKTFVRLTLIAHTSIVHSFHTSNIKLTRV